MKPFFKDMLKYISKRKQLTINQFNSLIPYLLNEDILTKLKLHRPFTVFNLENETPIKNKYQYYKKQILTDYFSILYCPFFHL